MVPKATPSLRKMGGLMQEILRVRSEEKREVQQSGYKIKFKNCLLEKIRNLQFILRKWWTESTDFHAYFIHLCTHTQVYMYTHEQHNNINKK